MGTSKILLSGGLLLAAAAAATCGAVKTYGAAGSDPKLVSSGGSVPYGTADGPVVVEAVYLTLEAGDPDAAAAEAARLARMYGGYEADRISWPAEGGKAVAQEIFVPLGRSDDFLARLLNMGCGIRESGTSRSFGYSGPGEGWAEFSIQYLPRRYPYAWDPGIERNLERAFFEFAAKAAAFFVQAAASLLVACMVVIPCAMMAVGFVTTIRWLMRGK
ncbi:MAG: hypothetical protein JW929_02050 [Anaerolineales bacterium]|nr:hypothetical protein [Anaerolineales bacterium]